MKKKKIAILLATVLAVSAGTGNAAMSLAAETASCEDGFDLILDADEDAELGLAVENAEDSPEEASFVEDISVVDEEEIPLEVAEDVSEYLEDADTAGIDEVQYEEDSEVEGITGTAANTWEEASDVPAAAASSSEVAVQVSLTYGQTEARAMLDLVNEFRTGDDAWYWNSSNTSKVVCSGLSKLTYDYALEAIAMQRAAEIALSFSHTRPDGTTCFTAYDEAVYVYSAAGENIAAGQTSAASAFTSWEEANEDYSGQGHRRNMLYSGFTAIGIGHVYYNGYHYWVQVFSNRVNSSTVTEANNSATTVAVDVSYSNIKGVSLSADPASLAMIVGESAALPTLTTRLSISDGWPSSSKTVSVPNTWTSANDACAEISGSQLIAKTVGTTSLSTTVLSETMEVPVTVQYDITKGKAVIAEQSFIYDGTAKKPSVTVTYEGTALLENTDYTISYSNNTNAGTGTVSVTGMGNYIGTITESFTINPASLSTATAELSSVSYTYDGTAKTPSVTVKYGGVTLSSGTDYTLSYSNNTAVGSAAATVTGVGNYTGSLSKSFTISLAQGTIISLTNKAKGITIEWNAVSGASGYYIYRRTAAGAYSSTPVKTVKSAATLSYTDKSVKDENGTVYVYKVVPYTGSFTGAAAEKTTVRLTGTSLTSVKNTLSRKLTAKWTAATEISGYQIQYSTDKTFSNGVKTKKVTNVTKTSKNISGLTTGSTYYVRIRTYTKVNGKTYYSAWSSKKKVTITK